MAVRSLRWVVAAAALVLTATTACTTERATRAGGAGALTLRVGTDDFPGRPAADQIEEYVRQVTRLSHGRIRLEPVWHAAGKGADDWDQAVSRLVSSGDLDLALVPSRAWDVEGVTTLRVLNAPFLITDERLVADVVSGELAAPMMSGLDAAGVVGLGLFPEGLRYVFSFGEPLLTPEDYRGTVVRAPRSETVYALFETLGATVDDYPDNFTHLVEAGTIDAAESGFAIADSLPAPATVASNLAMYPKVNVLVVNADVSRDLDPADLAVLEEAAVETRDRVVRDAVPEAEEAAAYCQRGGTVVAAPPEAGTALTAAARPVYVRLERDETTRSLIESVRTAKDALPPGPPVATCSSSARPHDEAGTAASAPITDGIYRYQVDFEYLVDAGLDPDQAAEESGVHTVTLDGGAYEDAWVNEDTTGRCTGRYRFDGPRITVSWSGSCVGDFAMTATVDGDQVHWRDIEALPPHSTPEDQVVNEAFNSVPWTRVGDVPN